MINKKKATDATDIHHDIHEVWAEYFVDRSNHQLRDLLVGYYLPWAKAFSTNTARLMRVGDAEGATGEALLKLFTKIIPNYDGRGTFERWAAVCLKRSVTDSLRRERSRPALCSFSSPVGHQPGRQRVGFDGLCLEDILPAKESQACSINFCELTADLDCDLAIVLWLRFYRGLTVMEVAKQLRIPKGTVQSRTYAAIKKLREKARNGDF